MATNLKNLKTDREAETKGRWVKYPGTDVRFLIARMGNAEFEAAIRARRGDARVQKAMQEQAAGELTEAESRAAIAPVVASKILLGWENLADENNQPMTYSPELATKLLSDPELHDLYTWVLKQSNREQLYRKYVEDQVAGN